MNRSSVNFGGGIWWQNNADEMTHGRSNKNSDALPREEAPAGFQELARSEVPVSAPHCTRGVDRAGSVRGECFHNAAPRCRCCRS